MKIGIITFHNSYNCGSMMQAFALLNAVSRMGHEVEIIDFSNKGQQELYSVFFRNRSLKDLVKNALILLCRKRVSRNFASYEAFKKKNFKLSPLKYSCCSELSDERYDLVIAGSDQVWNITIEDGDDAYFLPWVKKARRVAYAPSFGAKNILEYSANPQRYADYIKAFSAVSIREDNGRKWIEELAGLKVPVIIDPTLLLDQEDYDTIASTGLKLPEKYIFYYSPGYQAGINNLVKSISRKYGLPVIAFNAKSYYTKAMFLSSVKLPELENPSTYLQLIKHATMVVTTSFHGTVFSSIYRKRFWVVKNGAMFITDDRVPTLVRSLDLEDRVIGIAFDPEFDYMQEKDYSKYEMLLGKERQTAMDYLESALK